MSNRSYQRTPIAGSTRRSPTFTALLLAGLAVALTLGGAAHAEAPVVNFSPTLSDSALSVSIPASGGFTAKYSFDGQVEDAALDVWPSAVRDCDNTPPSSSEKQTYHLPLTLATEGGKTTGTAAVPHLQVSERFCFQFSWTKLALPDAKKVEQAIQAELIGTMDEAARLAERLVAAGARDFCALPGATESEYEKCESIDSTSIWYPLLEAVLKAKTLERDVVSLTKKSADVSAAIDNLKKNADFGAPNDLQDRVPSTVWVGAGVDAARIEKARRTINDNRKKLPQAPEMLAWLSTLETQQSLLTDVNAKYDKVQSEAETEKVAALAKQRDVALDFLKRSLKKRVSGTPFKARCQVNDFNNYLSPEVGMAVAVPFLERSSVTLVPYSAVNIYFTPVDRELALSQLVNGFGQRFSLTLGLSMTQSLKTRDVDFEPTVANTFGIAGAGYRVLPFARVAALLLFANAKPSGGYSADSKLVTAGALAISADVDVVTFLTSSLKK